MTVQEIIKLNPEEIAKHVVRLYVPIAEKKAVLQTLFDKSIAVTDVGTKYIDEFIDSINYVYGIIILYTDIELDTQTVFDDYDALMSSNAFQVILHNIPKDELDRLNYVHSCIKKTFDNIEKNIVEIVKRELNGAETIMQTIMDNIPQTNE